MANAFRSAVSGVGVVGLLAVLTTPVPGQGVRTVDSADVSIVTSSVPEQRVSVEHADVLPSFDRLLLDDAGRIWAREHPMAGVRDARWLVFDTDGRCMATASLPDRFQLHAVRGDRIIGVQRDALDVERVVAYPVDMPGSR